MTTKQMLWLFAGGSLVAATFCSSIYCVGLFVVVAIAVVVIALERTD